jgi:hypothetical protein
MDFGGSQDEDNMGWWFLESLEQSIGGASTKHMDFIYDIDLVTGLVWSIVDLLPEAPDIFNTSVTSSINLNHIQSPALGYCLANATIITWFTLAIGKTIYCLSQNTPGAGLARSSWTAEKIGMRHTPATEGVAQCLCYMFLPDYLS